MSSVTVDGEATPRSGTRIGRLVGYGASRTVAESLLAARGLTLGLLFGPSVFGVWALFRLIQGYVSLVHLGIPRGVEIEATRARSAALTRSPRATVVEADAAAGAWARTAAGFTWLVFGAIAVGSLGASWLVSDAQTALLLRALAAGILANRLWEHGRVFLRVTADLRRVATFELWNASLHLGLTLALAWQWGLTGAFVGFTLANLVTLPWMRRVPFAPDFTRTRLRRLLAVGIPVNASLLLTTGLATADRFAVAGIAGTTQLGYYAFAAAVAALAGSLALSMRTVVLREVYSAPRAASAENARAHLHRTVEPFALLYPAALGVVAIALEPAISLLTPAYREALPVAQILVFSGASAGIASLSVLPVVAGGRERWIPAVAGLAFAVNAVGAVAVIEAGAPLWAVGLLALAARMVHAVGILALARVVAGTAAPLRSALRSLGPLVYCGVAVAVAVHVSPGGGWLGTAAQLGIFALLTTPGAPAARRAVRAARGISE